MSSVFKAMATVAAWVLYVVGLLALLTAFVRIFRASLGAAPSLDVALMTAYFGYGVGSLFLSVVAMKLRKMLE